MADQIKNFAFSTVLTAPSPATSGTSLTVQSGDGAKFPTAPFYAVCSPAGVQPSTTNAEIVRVTAVSTDTFTITRAQDSSTAMSIAVGYQIDHGNIAAIMAQYAALSGATFTGAVTVPDLSVSGLTGAVSASRYVGATASGAPVSGTFAVGDFVIDQTGKVWVCTTAGTPGTWTQVGPSPSTTVTGPDAFGAAAVVGVGTTYSRADHNHGLPAAPAGLSPVAGVISTANYAQPTIPASNIVEVWGGDSGVYVNFDGNGDTVPGRSVKSFSSPTALTSIRIEPESVTGAPAWTAFTMPSSSDWYSVTYGNGKFVVVATSTSSAAAYSTDGINWTAATLPYALSWESVTYGNGKFVAVANGTTTAVYSTNGITWTAVAMPSSSIWLSVCYGNGKFVAVAYGSTAAAYAALTFSKPATFVIIPVDATTVY